MEALSQHFEEAIAASPFLAYLIVYVAGILTSFTPCVLPLFPVAVGTITTTARKREMVDGKLVETVTSRSRALLMGLSFALGLAAMFSLLGLLAALTGKAIFGILASSPITYLVLAGIMFLLALWLWKGDSVDPGASLQNWAYKKDDPGPIRKLVRWYSSTQGGGMFATFAFGFIYGIVAGPCTAPVIAAVLTYVAKAGEVFYGISLMFVYAMGLATLMVIAGVSATLAMRLKSQGKIASLIKTGFLVIIFFMAGYFIYTAASIGGWIPVDVSESKATIYQITDVNQAGAKGVDSYSVGNSLPDFKYTDFPKTQASKKLDLKDLRGKVVFITFWGNWCKACKEEIPEIKELQQHFKNNPDFKILSINVQDDPENVAKFAANLKITYPVIIDAEDTYAEERLNLTTFPHNIILDKNGKLVYSQSSYPKNAVALIDKLLQKLR